MDLKSITIELTQKCPNQCLHCSSLSGECSPPVLPPPEIDRIIESAHEIGATEVAFSGGEPLIQMTQLISGIQKAKELGMTTKIYTSGLLPSDQTVSRTEVQQPWMWATLKRYNKSIIPVFDIPTLDPALYDLITLYDRFQERWTDVCPERRLPKILILITKLYNEIGLDPEINFVPMRINCNSFDFVLDWATDHKIRTNVLAYVEQGRAIRYSGWLSMSYRELDRFRLIVWSLAARTRGKGVPYYNLRIGTPLQYTNNETHCCTACSEKCVVRYDGKVIGCEALKQLSIINGALDNDPTKVFARDIRKTPLDEACKCSEFSATLSSISTILSKIKCRTPCPVQNLMYNRPEMHQIPVIGEYRNE